MEDLLRPGGRLCDRPSPCQAWWIRTLSILLLRWIKHQEHEPWLPRRNDIRLPTGIFNTASHKTNIHMSRGTWYEMFLPFNVLAYRGDGGLGAWETQKSTSSEKKPPSKVNVPPHSLPVSRNAVANCKEPFQHASKTNSTHKWEWLYTTSSRVALFVYLLRRSVVRFHWGQIIISACLRKHHHMAARMGNGMLCA
jgi:hypothetical protein